MTSVVGEAMKLLNKSEFARELLEKDPNTTAGEAAKVWIRKGHAKDEESLKKFKQSFNNYKTIWNRKRASAPTPIRKAADNGNPVPQNEKTAKYDEIEAKLDQVIMQAMELRDDRLTEHLRIARREIARKLL